MYMYVLFLRLTLYNWTNLTCSCHDIAGGKIAYHTLINNHSLTHSIFGPDDYKNPVQHSFLEKAGYAVRNIFLYSCDIAEILLIKQYWYTLSM